MPSTTVNKDRPHYLSRERRSACHRAQLCPVRKPEIKLRIKGPAKDSSTYKITPIQRPALLAVSESNSPTPSESETDSRGSTIRAPALGHCGRFHTFARHWRTKLEHAAPDLEAKHPQPCADSSVAAQHDPWYKAWRMRNHQQNYGVLATSA